MDGTPNPLDELLAAVGRDVLPWDRDVEPMIAGQVITLDERDNEYGMFPVLTLLTGDGREVEIAGMGAVLHRAFMTNGIEPGDFLAVRYLGQRTPRSGGKKYHDYKVVLRDSTGAPKRHQAVATPTPPDAAAAALAELEHGVEDQEPW